MDFDVEGNLGAAERSVWSMERDGRPARAVTLSRSYRDDGRGLVGRRDQRQADSALVSDGRRRARTLAAATSWKAMRAAWSRRASLCPILRSHGSSAGKSVGWKSTARAMAPAAPV